MFQIYFDTYLIYDPRLQDYVVREPRVHLAVGQAGRMSFKLDPGHPNLSRITKLKGTVKLLQDGSQIYAGRVIKTDTDFLGTVTVETEGLLAALNDTVLPAFNFPDQFAADPDYQTAAASGNVVEYFLGWILSTHNAQVDTDRQIQLGTVTVTDPNNYIARSAIDPHTPWEIIPERLPKSSLGGYLVVRYEGTGTYLDYVDDFSLTNVQEVDFGRNLLDLLTEAEGSDTYSQIYPIGSDGLTLADLPDGAIDADLVKEGEIIYSTAARSSYGKITRIVEWPDVTVASNLQTKAAAELKNVGSLLTNSIRVRACDLHYADGTIPTFRVGRYVQLNSTPHGYSAALRLMEMDLDIMNPGRTEIVLGAILPSGTARAVDAEQAAAALADLQEQQIAQNAQGLDALTQSVSEQITSAVQTAQSIVLTALENYVATGDFQTYQETVSAQLAVLSNSITVSISQVTSQIAQVGDDLQQQLNEVTASFRFTADGLVIGQSGSEILLRLKNDTIEFLQNNLRGLWMDQAGLHADSVAVDRIQIGRAEFVGDENGLTLRKAVN